MWGVGPSPPTPLPVRWARGERVYVVDRAGAFSVSGWSCLVRPAGEVEGEVKGGGVLAAFAGGSGGEASAFAGLADEYFAGGVVVDAAAGGLAGGEATGLALGGGGPAGWGWPHGLCLSRFIAKVRRAPGRDGGRVEGAGRRSEGCVSAGRRERMDGWDGEGGETSRSGRW